MTARQKRAARKIAKPPGAVIYTRVSTTKQAVHGVGIESQLSKCREHCARLGLEVLSVRSDPATSGRDGIEDRPGLQSVIADVNANPGAIVVVYSLSRLGRSQRLIWTLLDDRGDYALPLSSATESFDTASPMGRAMLGMLGVWAQLEADLVAERTVDALAAISESGKRLGAPSMAEVVDEDGTRRFDPAKVAIVRRVKALYQGGGYTHRSLADKLNAQKFKSVRGGKWWSRTVRVAINTVLPEV
jgi:site-specific DNA recombinase